jgi:hypothetical protein
MKRGRSYTIFPTTWKSRLLLAVAFIVGLAIIPWGLFVWSLGHPEIDITYENHTSGDITILVDGWVEGRIGPRNSETFTDRRAHWDDVRLIEFVDETGRLLFTATLDIDDLERMGYRVMIEEP